MTGPSRRGRRPLLALSVGLLAVVFLVELVAGPLLRPARSPRNQARVLAISGVPALLGGTSIDPTELAQVARSQQRPVPLGLPTAAVVDALLLVAATVAALPWLARGLGERAAGGGGRAVNFGVSLVAVLVGIGLVVAAVRRMRYLTALYLSPPLGTLNYLLLFGSFRRDASVEVAGVVLVLKAAASLCFLVALPARDSRRGVAGLIFSSMGGTVVTLGCYALLPGTRATIADALAAALVAVMAIFWAGVLLSGSVRRLV